MRSLGAASSVIVMLGKTAPAGSRWKAYAALALAGVLLQGQTAKRPLEDAAGPGEFAGKLVVVPVKGADVSSGERLRSLRLLLRDANADGAAGIILRIDTPSGYSADLAGLLLGELGKLETPVHALADSSALGMGALAAVVSNSLYLAPSGVLGGATPTVEGEPGEETEETQGLTRSVLKAQVRSLAGARGRSAKLVEALIDANAAARLRRDAETGEADAEDAEVLTLTADEAVKPYLGEPALADGIASSVEELIRKESLKEEVVEIRPGEWERRRQERARGSTAADEAGDVDGVTPRPGGESYAGKILVMEVGQDDLLSKARFEFMERVLDRARMEKAEALILDMNTPGGVAWETSQLILRPFQNLPFPTYTFVNPHAESAGALIAVATDHIYMYPTSTIGSALLVTSTGADLPENMKQKMESMLRSEIRNVAIAKGHNPDVAEAFVTTETRVEMDGVVICERGEVLNLNAVEATRVFDGKPVLAKGVAESVGEIIEREGLEGERVLVEPQGLELFAEWVQLASVLLIAVGLAGAYLELNSPGFGIPGLISVLAFSLFFFGNFLAGNLVGYGTAVVFALGFILLVLEFLVIPGTFIAGSLGALLMLGSLGAALIDRVEFEDLRRGGESAPSFLAVFQAPALTLALSLLLAIGMIALLMRFFPVVGPFSGLVLQGSVAGGTSITGSSAGNPDLMTGGRHHLDGERGEAITDLRPAGKAKIAGALYDVTTDSEYVSRGERIRVLEVRGNRIVVAAEDLAV